MKLKIKNLEYNCEDYEIKYTIHEYAPKRRLRILLEGHYENEDFINLGEELNSANNIIKIIDSNGQLISSFDLSNLDFYFYDKINNALIFTTPII